MTRVLLVRHGTHDLLGKVLTGRMPGVSLNDYGCRQAEEVAGMLSCLPISAIYASPLERAQETADPLANLLGLPITECGDIHEIDFGDWSGSRFEELESDPEWKRFNEFRKGTRAPGGEVLTETQERMVGCIERMARDHPDTYVTLFSHGDPIKVAIAHYAGISLDHFHRLEINTASVSGIEINPWEPKVLFVNRTTELPGV